MVRKLAATLLTLVCLVSPGIASAAYNPLSKACSTEGATASTACNSSTTRIDGPNGIIRKVTTIIASVAGVVAVIVIMIGGLQYIVSNGDSQKTVNARSAIIGGAVGLSIIVAAQGIILLVLKRLE